MRDREPEGDAPGAELSDIDGSRGCGLASETDDVVSLCYGGLTGGEDAALPPVASSDDVKEQEPDLRDVCQTSR